MHFPVMDRSLRKVNPTTTTRITVLPTSYNLSARHCLYLIHVPRLPLHDRRSPIRWRLQKVHRGKRIRRRHSNLLWQHDPLPFHLHAIHHLLPLLQHFETFQETYLHKPSVFDISDHNDHLSNVLDTVLGLILRMAFWSPLASRRLQAVLNGNGGGQYRMFLRVREVLHRMVQPLLRDQQTKLENERVNWAHQPTSEIDQLTQYSEHKYKNKWI